MTAESNELLDGEIVSEDKKLDSVPSESRESGLTSLEKALEEAEGWLFSAAYRKNLVDETLNDISLVGWGAFSLGMLISLAGLAIIPEGFGYGALLGFAVLSCLAAILFLVFASETARVTIKQFPRYFELKDSQTVLAEEISKHSNEIQRLKELIVDSSRRGE
jgi:hypothetical protein